MAKTKSIGNFYDVSPNQIITIKCSEEFKVYQVDLSGEALHYIGPDRSTDRKFVFKTDASMERLEVVTDGLLDFIVKDLPSPQEINSPVPIEAITERPLTLKEELMQYFSHQLQQMRSSEAETEFESLEEADDFDIDDDELPLSKYELDDMIEEEPISLLQTPPASEDHVSEAQPEILGEKVSETPEAAKPSPAIEK